MAPTDRDVLVALYDATDGPNWNNKTNWGSDAPLSDWYGVTANDQGRVVTLTLPSNNLRGPIPRELGNLTALQRLDLRANNTLSGRIPSELGHLSALQWPRIHRNQLSGPIPRELGNLAALQSLNLGANTLSGRIPSELGHLSALQWLRLDGNQLSGPIPKELGALSRLEKLWLCDNNLTGPIPPELGKLTALQELNLWKNQLSGTIPPELGVLRELQELVLQYNQLSALWDHTQDIHGVEDEEGTKSESGGPVPHQLRRLLDVLDRAAFSQRLFDNPWAEPPESIVAKGKKAVRAYFEDMFSEPCRIQRNSVKVVLVGQEGAGKTSLCRSMKANKAAPTGEWKENSTVFADVEPMVLEGASVRMYDCAGQVAYTGLLQMFLTPRSVCVLVCDAAAFEYTNSGTDGQVEKDCRKLEELRVCDWLRSISRRVPRNDVILVATKCDLVGGDPRETGQRIEEACRTWLASWVDAGMQPVTAEEGVSLTSCCASEIDGQGEDSSGGRALEGGWACDWRDTSDEDDSPSLIHRLVHKRDGLGLRGAQMVLPRSWDIALTVLEALERGRDPVEMTLRKLADPDGRGGAAGMAKRKRGAYQGITQDELSAKWLETVHELANKEVTIINPEHALEGALSIREFDGSLVRHQTYVFLDVVWLARILKPLLNHKDEETFNGLVKLGDTGDTRVTLRDKLDIASWGRLKNEGVLEPRLARAMWPVGLSEYVLSTLLSLGLTFPLDNDPADGLVVLLRLGEDRPNDVGKELDDFRRDHTAVLSVTWKVFMGVPPGAIEKVLTRCCSIGAIQTFWRFGVLVQGGFGAVGAGKTFALLAEYSHEKTEIDMKVYGNNGTSAPWAALSHGISAVRMMCSDFPGLRWRASLKCPQHEQDMHISDTATRPGDKLLHGKTCSLCSSETGGLGAAATDLVEMVDVLQSRGEIFRQFNGRFSELQGRYPVLRPEVSRELHPGRAQRQFDEWLKGMKEEVNSLLHGAKTSAEGANVGDKVKAGEIEDVSAILEEVAKVQQKLEQQHEDVRRWLGANNQRVSQSIDADDGVMGALDSLKAMLMAVRREGIDTPRQACILPPWKFAKAHGLSEDEQTPEVWVKRLQEWREDDFKEGKGFFKKKKRLFLVCAQTHRLVPCGPNGQGYDIQQPRTWLRISVRVATFALQVVCSTLAAMAAVPVAGAGAAVEAAVETSASAAMESFQSMLETQLQRLTLDDDRADVDVGSQVAQLERGAYASLREFIHGMEDSARLDIAKAGRSRRAAPNPSEFVFFAQEMVQVQRRVGDAAVQWVLKGQESAWFDAMRSAPIA